jgi:hypothetical protein
MVSIPFLVGQQKRTDGKSCSFHAPFYIYYDCIQKSR